MDFNHITQQSVNVLYYLTALRSTVLLEYEKIQRDIEKLTRIEQDYLLLLSPVLYQLNDLLVRKQNQMHDLDMQIKTFALACDQAQKTMENYKEYDVKLGAITYPNAVVRSRILVEFRE